MFVVGTTGLAWALIWLMMIRDSPEKHRRMSIIEKEYIHDNVVMVRRERVRLDFHYAHKMCGSLCVKTKNGVLIFIALTYIDYIR